MNADSIITEQMNLAQEPWIRAIHTLRSYPEVEAILNDLYSRAFPYLIKGHKISPIHHVAYVVSFMARIVTSEGLSPSDIKRGVLAALLHDVGIGEAGLPKITEEMIKTAPEAEHPRLRQEGIAHRREHMLKGVEIARKLLIGYPWANDDIDVILDIVGTHDNSKIPLLEETIDKKWLLSPKQEDWLKQCHWEADALWMLSPAGILVDIKRQGEEDTPGNRRAKFNFNLGLHQAIVKVYEQAFSPEEMRQFSFRDGLLYRTKTGYDMAMEFKRQTRRL